MTSKQPVITGTGGVAQRAGMSRALFQYRLDRGELPGPSIIVADRRLFTEADIQKILTALQKRPALRVGRAPASGGGGRDAPA